ncbi:MAG: ABC transporter ATP-binding protein [Myxococcales bacterium]|nr:ABC transporter ATP-binding protein [Myxococcales bacterium]
MSLLTVDEVSVSFGKKVLLDAASLAVQPGERIGLVGPNGSGKTTLLRLLAGEREADSGDIARARGVRVGYLPQDILELPPGTLVESVRAAVGGRDSLTTALEGVEADLAAATDDDERLEYSQHLADLHVQLDDFEERYGRHRALAILAGLGFLPSDYERPVAEFSGGWKMRAALAGLLLLSPDLLLLDEPTNHLDLPSLQWFDHFLSRSSQALILVSHDRDFLNRQITRVVSFETEGLRSYPGDYEHYRKQRAEEEINLELRAKRQAAERATMERFIDRFRSKASKARQVQSRIKLMAKQETVQIHEHRKTVRFRFPEVPRAGRDVLRLDGVQKRFGERVVYRGLTRTITRGERVAIIGANGAGKTTLLKLVAGELTAEAGSIRFGENVKVAYYAQHHTEKLDPERTILDQTWSLVPRESQSFVRGVLGSFLFSGDDVEKRIGVLSGGERARVALARLLVEPANLLLMDEPTNHLDLDSSERLVEALADYGGTLLFVSHNRSFINQLATRVWDVGGGDLTEWAGNLDDYLYHLDQLGTPLGGVPTTRREPTTTAENDRTRRQREARERETRAVRTRPLRKEVDALEVKVAELESERKVLETSLADRAIFDDFARARPMLDRFQTLGEELEKLYVRWAERQERLDEAERG